MGGPAAQGAIKGDAGGGADVAEKVGGGGRLIGRGEGRVEMFEGCARKLFTKGVVVPELVIPPRKNSVPSFGDPQVGALVEEVDREAVRGFGCAVATMV
ncbi:MAG TPA: hypothetical protein VMB71_05535 [Acetobacteraceae bacterium]|nr:hypothetical protein [Acetobacteraceae bacterium]